MNETRSTCPYCGVGCGVIIAVRGRRRSPTCAATRDTRPTSAACARKGSTLHLTAAPHVAAQTRLLRPMQRAQRAARRPRRSAGTARSTRWPSASSTRDRATTAPTRSGFYVSGQLLTEDYYVFNKLAKGLLGTNNIDTNSRLCMSSAVAGYKATLGADAPPACYDDLAHADLRLHRRQQPRLGASDPVPPPRGREGGAARRMKSIVVDPRRTETAAMADLHLPILPGTDVALVQRPAAPDAVGGLDRRRASSPRTPPASTRCRRRVRDCTPSAWRSVCGMREEDIVQAARWFGDLAGDAVASTARA